MPPRVISSRGRARNEERSRDIFMEHVLEIDRPYIYIDVPEIVF